MDEELFRVVTRKEYKTGLQGNASEEGEAYK
jgi:hypothetical protein